MIPTNNSMNLTYNNKEINNQTTINNTSTNVDPNNITKPKIIMNTVNENPCTTSIYRTVKTTSMLSQY